MHCREREVVAAELRLRYNALKARWKSVLELSSADDERAKLCNPSYLQADGDECSGQSTTEPDGKSKAPVDDQFVFLQMQAQVSGLSSYCLLFHLIIFHYEFMCVLCT